MHRPSGQRTEGEAVRGCGTCAEVGKRCPDCLKHLMAELRLIPYLKPLVKGRA